MTKDKEEELVGDAAQLVAEERLEKNAKPFRAKPSKLSRSARLTDSPVRSTPKFNQNERKVLFSSLCRVGTRKRDQTGVVCVENLALYELAGKTVEVEIIETDKVLLRTKRQIKHRCEDCGRDVRRVSKCPCCDKFICHFCQCRHFREFKRKKEANQ